MITRRTFGLAGLASLLGSRSTQAQQVKPTQQVEPVPTEQTNLAHASVLYRPQIHYSPPTGFMNDPNGLILYAGEYHLFYQYNPHETRAGHVHWGHAVSPDLLHWKTLPMALKETAAGQAFSGSAVLDARNTSGLFRSGEGGLVAIYTRASATKQAQAIAVSHDKGRTFAEYVHNPVLDVGSDSFRDPKVLWHRATNRWIMAAVLARKHHVVFYSSSDLTHWKELSRFGMAGVLGIDYECPDLVEVPAEGGGMKWVLFVSINPGAPQGGSAVQYFVGNFDGIRFTPDDAVTRFADFGKDFYALQTYAGLPEGAPVAIAWLSNWQYCNETPTGNWRGVMSLPRRLTLRRRSGDWRLAQTPVGLEALREKPLLTSGARAAGSGELRTTSLPIGAAVEARVRMQLAPNAVATLRFANGNGEHLDIGYDATAAQLFVDRGAVRGFTHRFFTDKFAFAADAGTRSLDLHVVFDRCTLEVFAQSGEAVGSFLHFFAAPADRCSLMAQGQVSVTNMQMHALRSTFPAPA